MKDSGQTQRCTDPGQRKQKRKYYYHAAALICIKLPFQWFLSTIASTESEGRERIAPDTKTRQSHRSGMMQKTEKERTNGETKRALFRHKWYKTQQLRAFARLAKSAHSVEYI